MVIFNVTTKYEANDALLKSKITERFPSDYYEIGRGQWLVAFSGTSRELYTKLFPEPELSLPRKDVIVFGIGGYWGHSSQDMWEWIRTKLGS
jgi:hypothetical protein